MSSRSKNILIALLSIAIISINLVSVLYYLSHRTTAEHVFGNPDTIEIKCGEKLVSLSADDKAYSKILTYTDERTNFSQYYIPSDTSISFDEYDNLCIRFVYNDAFCFAFDYQYERKMITAESIVFPLKEAVNSYVTINTADGSETISGLAISAELINLADELLK